MTDPESRIRVLSPLFWAAMLFCLLCFTGAGFIALTAVRPAWQRVHHVAHTFEELREHLLLVEDRDRERHAGRAHRRAAPRA